MVDHAAPRSLTVMLRKMLCESGRASSSKVSAGVSGSTAASRMVQKNPSFEVTCRRRTPPHGMIGISGELQGVALRKAVGALDMHDAELETARDAMRMHAGSAAVTRRLYWSLDHSSETLLLRCFASGTASTVCCAAMLDCRTLQAVHASYDSWVRKLWNVHPDVLLVFWEKSGCS